MNSKEKLIKQIEQEITKAQAHIQTWEDNLERYKSYLRELIDQLLTLKLEIKNQTK